MTTITLTHHYSGFRNVCDTYSVGSHEDAGNAASGKYGLPDGYSADHGDIYDADGWRCEIVADDVTGRPALMSYNPQSGVDAILLETV